MSAQQVREEFWISASDLVSTGKVIAYQYSGTVSNLLVLKKQRCIIKRPIIHHSAPEKIVTVPKIPNW